MANPVQCDNCGAMLSDEDIFCGECGTPRPAPAFRPEAAGPAAAPPPSAPMAAPSLSPAAGPLPQPSSRAGGVSQGWRTAAIVVAILAAVAAVGLCISGLILAFLVRDPELGQAGTQDMIIGSSVCCLCPGVLALIVAIVLWVFVIRRK
jgi:zinc-ribbon domain